MDLSGTPSGWSRGIPSRGTDRLSKKTGNKNSFHLYCKDEDIYLKNKRRFCNG
jgi:hypothetical protein